MLVRRRATNEKTGCPPMSRKVAVRSRLRLDEVEGLLSQVQPRALPTATSLWLARDIGPGFFVEARIVGLIATAAANGGVEVIDWVGRETTGWKERFGQTISGLAATAYCNDIRTVGRRLLNLDFGGVREEINLREGLAEASSTLRSRVSTYCAFDDDRMRRPPLAFAASVKRESFRDAFERRMDLLGHDAFAEGPERARSERAVADFVFELFQNTSEHGALGQDGQVLRGFRFLQVRRHIANSLDQLLDRAKGFPQLQEHLQATCGGARGSIRLCEISIGDRGLGVVERLVSTRPALAPRAETWQQRCRFVNDIVREALSSKVAIAGAGHGLDNVLTSLQPIGGFLTLRTGDLWLWGGPRARVVGLKPVLREPSPRIVGTHYSVLFRLA